MRIVVLLDRQTLHNDGLARSLNTIFATLEAFSRSKVDTVAAEQCESLEQMTSLCPKEAHFTEECEGCASLDSSTVPRDNLTAALIMLVVDQSILNPKRVHVMTA
jgi:hypothetical protein